MLVLSRKVNEEIQIGKNVSITVLSVAGNKVRLGIAAPQSVSIRRSEVEPPVRKTFELVLDAERVALC